MQFDDLRPDPLHGDVLRLAPELLRDVLEDQLLPADRVVLKSLRTGLLFDDVHVDLGLSVSVVGHRVPLERHFEFCKLGQVDWELLNRRITLLLRDLAARFKRIASCHVLERKAEQDRELCIVGDDHLRLERDGTLRSFARYAHDHVQLGVHELKAGFIFAGTALALNFRASANERSAESGVAVGRVLVDGLIRIDAILLNLYALELVIALGTVLLELATQREVYPLYVFLDLLEIIVVVVAGVQLVKVDSGLLLLRHQDGVFPAGVYLFARDVDYLGFFVAVALFQCQALSSVPLYHHLLGNIHDRDV